MLIKSQTQQSGVTCILTMFSKSIFTKIQINKISPQTSQIVAFHLRTFLIHINLCLFFSIIHALKFTENG